jgi:hypothetical protein
MRSLCLVVLILLSLYFQLRVSSQGSAEKEPSADKTEKAATVTVGGRGFPRVNFTDGKQLQTSPESDRNGSPAKVLTSADFDSDGTADLIVADLAGNLKFYRGNVDSIFPNSAEANE